MLFDELSSLWLALWQVLALAAGDAPLLEVHDNWRGDPALAFTCSPDGTNSIQSEQRLLGRVSETNQL
jgi:hypothetical protein